MNESNFLRKRGEVSHGRRQATRTTLRLLAALFATFAVGLAASGGTSATTATEASLELVKTVDAETVDAGDPIGFRIDLTNHAEPRGRIFIEKRLEPSPNSAPSEFSFTGNLGPFTLGSFGGFGRDLQRTFTARLPGTYSVTESTLSEGFQLSDLACDDADSSVDLQTRTATIQLEAGETVRCTFTNSNPDLEPDGNGLVIIEKRAPADQDPQVNPSGRFTSDLPQCGFLDPSDFTLVADGPAATCSLIVPGTYTVTETEALGAGAEFVSLSCDDDNSSVDPATRTATIRVAANETVRCVFVNRTPSAADAAQNVVITDTLPSGPGLNWSIDPAVPGCSIEGSSLSCLFAELADGQTVSVHVTSPTTLASCGRYDNTAIARADNRAEVQSSASVTVICPSAGTIIVEKQTTPDGATQSFEFDPSYGANFFLSDGQMNNSGFLNPGTYSVAEVNIPADWDLTSTSCTDGSPVNAIDLNAGETVTCTFNDRQDGTAEVIKTVNGAAPTGSQSFTFQIRQGASAISAGTILEQRDANAGNGGLINFATLLMPGTTYQLCEIVMPGWMTTLGPPFFTVFTPSGDNSTVCTNFTVQPGELKTFTINNIPPPGGLARTIGFWKNWASCSGSNGHQRPVLDRTLAAAEPGGIMIGDLILHGSAGNPDVAPDCQKAVRILKKSIISDGRNMSSDPAFNLAAQLLAATLNFVAGAGTCPAAVTAINDGQALLDAINFNGNTHLNMTTAQRNLANSLAATLDSYNNNTLC